jgi:hypothetical protein
LVLFALGSVGPSSAVDTAVPGGLSGRVRDLVGNVLSDVEILLVAPSRTVHPVATVRSDATGSFSIRGLEPGRYRLAALKHGYLTFVGEVNTRVQSWVDVVLHPDLADGERAESGLPRDPAWSLRLPRRSVLRETGNRVAIVRDEEPQPAGARHDPALSLEVEQLFAMKRGLPDGEGRRPGGTGSETRLRLASAIGKRGQIRVLGARQSYDGDNMAGDLATAAREGAESVHVGVSYDTGIDSQVRFQAYYTSRDLQLSPVTSTAPAAVTTQARRSWGYDAAWSKQLDPVSSLAVKLDFKDTVLQLPAGATQVPAGAGPGVVEAVSNRALGATGSYESLPAADHRLKLGLQARVLDPPPATILLPVPGSHPDGSYGVEGVSLGLAAQDTWHVAGPFALVYGLEYRHSLAGRDISLIAPRLGGSWSLQQVGMRFLVSYHGVTHWGRDDPSATAPPFRPEGRLGYEAELELPLGRGLSVTGGTRFSPLQLDFKDHARGGVGSDPQPIYVTDGNAAVEEYRAAVVHEATGARTSLEFARGSVRGTLAPVLPYELPYRFLYQGRLRYDTSRLGVRVTATGTNVRVDFRRVTECSASRAEAGWDSVQSSLGLHVTQDLLRLRSLGDWRLLVALRVASLENDPSRDGVGRPAWGEAPWLGNGNHEMSAGLSVLF